MWTDTFQVLMMFAGMLAVMIRGTLSLQGGITEVWEAAANSERLEFFKYVIYSHLKILCFR
jgi:Na+/proline symporter